jgi:four helix bundle protein
MMKRQESIIKEKSEAFSKRIVRLYKYLTQQKGETIISKQIYRSGTSIGANIAESKFAQSPADFISKLSIALKEANETEYWLKNLFYGDNITERQYTSMFNDVEEIIKILVKSIKTLKLKNGKL